MNKNIRVGSIICCSYSTGEIVTGIIIDRGWRNVQEKYKVRWFNDPDNTAIMVSWESSDFIRLSCKVLVP